MSRVTISLTEKQLKKIDAKRGLVKRSTWIMSVIDKHLNDKD